MPQAPDGLLQLSDSVTSWAVRSGTRAYARQEYESAARWALIAAQCANDFGHSWLSSTELESLLVKLAAQIEPKRPASDRSSLRRWLHVFTETYAFGGHTTLARRWIEHNPFGERHDLVVTCQPKEHVEATITAACMRAGGAVVALDATQGLLARASALRNLALERADVVVIHAHEWDVIPPLAFGVSGGPPVLLLNHADHSFWVGSASADRIIDIRTSGQYLTKTSRGIPESLYLPIPLEDHGPAVHDRLIAAGRAHEERILGAGVVFLTVGRSPKYVSTPRLDFMRAATRILANVEDSVLIAVGPQPWESTWLQLRRETRGRAIAVGTDIDLRPWFEAADVYLEGFPVGSYTALLECALAGRAFVRKPLLVSRSALPTDEGALASFPTPETEDAYVDAACALALDTTVRRRMEEDARSAIAAHHCGEGWAAHLRKLQDCVPLTHEPAVRGDATPLAAELIAYRRSYRLATTSQDPFTVAVRRALAQRLQPRFDRALLRNVIDACSRNTIARRPVAATAARYLLAACSGWTKVFRGRAS